MLALADIPAFFRLLPHFCAMSLAPLNLLFPYSFRLIDLASRYGGGWWRQLCATLSTFLIVPFDDPSRDRWLVQPKWRRDLVDGQRDAVAAAYPRYST